jgi:ABC-2 type transport system ATP-binding protein
MSEPALSLVNVVKRYGAVNALRGVSFDVKPGEMFGLIGPDGAGKTTTIRLLCGLLHSDGGTVRVLGKDPVAQHRQVTESVGYLSQRFSLYGDLSIDENIAFFAEIHGLSKYDERRTRLLELTQLAQFRSRLADRLSGGMKQKLALACTLIHKPRVILLDEPTTGVDPVSRREFWKLLAEFLSQGLTIVMATPYLDEAERCGRVALVNEGRLLALDEPANLAAAMSGTILEIVATPARQALQILRARLGRERVQLFGDRLHVRVDREAEGAGLLAELEREGLAGGSARAIVPTLEDVFIERLALARAAGPSPAAPAAGSRR